MKDNMYRILVVDDEPQIVELLQIYLEMQGHKVTGAYDGAQALKLWKQDKFDMVLTDIMMPQVDGYDLVEKIRNDLFVKLQKLPVRYFDAHPTGELMSRFTNDVDAIDMMINSSATSLISGTISLVGTLALMVYTNWVLTLITLAFI